LTFGAATGLLTGLALMQMHGSTAVPAAKKQEKVSARMPLFFVEDAANQTFFAPGRNTSVEFRAGGLVYHLSEPVAGPKAPHPNARRVEPGAPRKVHDLYLDFVGANGKSLPVGGAQLRGTHSTFLKEQAEWKAGMRTFATVTYKELWPGIDLVYSGEKDQLKYNFYVKPGANPKQIRLAWRGATSMGIDAAGALRLTTPAGPLSDEKPYVYQETAGKRDEVKSAFSLTENELSFQIGNYDRTKTLVVDPAQFVYATFIGGSADDRGLGVAVDNQGQAYMTGRTYSPNTNSMDVLVVKMSADGSQFLWSALIGGSGDDEGFDIAIDATGASYVVGMTSSTNFARTVGPDLTYNGGATDAFVLKINPAGNALVFSGYIGGSGTDFAEGVAVDGNGNIYVEGPTNSTQATFPVLVGPDLTANGKYDIFVTKVNATGNALIYSGFIGGSGDDCGNSAGWITSGHITLDSAGNAYISGETKSTQTTFPNGNGFGTLPSWDKTHNGAYDAFLVKVKADGTGLAWAGYVGGKLDDMGFGVALDPSGNVYFTGQTNSSEATFPTGSGFGNIPGYDKTYAGGTDAFVAKVNPSGTALLFVTYLGGTKLDNGNAVAVDGAGNVYVAGHTESPEFPVLVGPDLTFNGPSTDGDAFITKLDTTGTQILYSGFIGGAGDDHAFWIALDPFGNAYVVGDADANSKADTFPNGNGLGSLPGAQRVSNGGWEAFLVKISN
jgi:hypothetical protein